MGSFSFLRLGDGFGDRSSKNATKTEQPFANFHYFRIKKWASFSDTQKNFLWKSRLFCLGFFFVRILGCLSCVVQNIAHDFGGFLLGGPQQMTVQVQCDIHSGMA